MSASVVEHPSEAIYAEGMQIEAPHPESSRARTWAEIVIVLALSLGASALYSLVSFIDKATRETALSEQASELNRTLAERPAFDLTYQLLGIVLGLAPVALVIFLTWQRQKPHLAGLGITELKPSSLLRDAGGGVALAAAVGIPGIGLYVIARILGLNTQVVASSLAEHWYTVPVLVLAALNAALLEEFIVVAYLFNRLHKLGWRPWSIIVFSAVLRASYHLYQGVGGFVGNLAMGFLFAWVYKRWGRLLPLVIAHWMLDIASFVGYAWVASVWPEIF